jgi:hypothetical protein
MKPLPLITGLLLAFGLAVPVATGEKNDDGFVTLFNGRDLTGWVNVNCAPSTFYVKDHEIITTGKPTGYLRTATQYENFIADFEWKHVPPAPGEVGNSGFFVWADPIPAIGSGYTRGIEVQVLVNLTYKDPKTGSVAATSQGDLFSIWGAHCVPDRPHPLGWDRCLPSENRCKGAGEWNHYRLEAHDGVIKLAVNGKVVSGVNQCRPRKGYLALESEGSECHFRNLKIKELPSTNPRPNEVADQDRGYTNLYTGLDLSGWHADEKAKQHWLSRDYVLHYDGKGTTGQVLQTAREYGDAEYLVDFRFPAKREAEVKPCEFLLAYAGNSNLSIKVGADGRINTRFTKVGPVQVDTGRRKESRASLKPAGEWNRVQLTIQGTTLVISMNGSKPEQFDTNLPASAKRSFALRPGGEMDFANLFARELK